MFLFYIFPYIGKNIVCLHTNTKPIKEVFVTYYIPILQHITSFKNIFQNLNILLFTKLQMYV